MSFCDLVPPTTIPQDRLLELEGALAQAGRRIKTHASKSSASSAAEFFCSFVKAYRAGSPVSACGLLVSAEDADKMVVAKALEGELLSGFSRGIQQCILRCAKSFGRQPDELEGVAYECFYNAVVNYDGSSRFCTFLFTCLRRGLARFCAGQSELGVPENIRKLTMRVTNTMAKEGRTFDDAISRLGVSKKQTLKVCAAMRTVQRATDLKIRESEMASSLPRDDARWVLEAIGKAELGSLERAAFEAFMDAPAGSQGLAAGCRHLVNPQTGKPYSRAALSSAWRQARKKIARVLGEAA